MMLPFGMLFIEVQTLNAVTISVDQTLAMTAQKSPLTSGDETKIELWKRRCRFDKCR